MIEMSWVKVKVVKCRSASIRRKPWDPFSENEIVDIRDGPYENATLTKRTGDTLEIDPDIVVYSWTDRKYYKVRDPDGWIYEGCIDFGGDSNG